MSHVVGGSKSYKIIKHEAPGTGFWGLRLTRVKNMA